jgi:23S rRNA (uracil1939-C5)-methyltransferase
MAPTTQWDEVFEVTVEKLVFGGQGIGKLANGKTVFIWNALPGERVMARIIKHASSYDEAVATEIIQASNERVIPKDKAYLSTSPWQIINFDAENRYKKDITVELMDRQSIQLPVIKDTTHTEQDWYYRNKMEYNFANTESIDFAIYERGSHNKVAIKNSSLALPNINQIGNDLCDALIRSSVKANDLNTIIIRSSRLKNVVAHLFVNDPEFQKVSLPDALSGLRVSYRQQIGPRLTRTQLLYELGNTKLDDDLLGHNFGYDIDSFFQINLPVFELAIKQIKQHINESDVVDVYAGVGAIGLSVARSRADLIELDSSAINAAHINAKRCGIDAQFFELSSEKALSRIVADKPLIVDPPRSGLHDKLTAKILETHPRKIAYLSCNPATQARDLRRLKDDYKVDYFEVYNFFPKTPEIETLAILSLK